MAIIKSLLTQARHLSQTSAPSVLRIGDILTQSRIFTNEDVVEYSKVSYDSNPLHFDAESARKAGFEGQIVHGMLVASLFPRIISSQFPGAVYVSQSLHFKLPVYTGDEIVGEVTALSLKEHKERFIAKFTTKCYKNREQLVVDGEAMTILPFLDMKTDRSCKIHN